MFKHRKQWMASTHDMVVSVGLVGTSLGQGGGRTRLLDLVNKWNPASSAGSPNALNSGYLCQRWRLQVYNT